MLLHSLSFFVFYTFEPRLLPPLHLLYPLTVVATATCKHSLKNIPVCVEQSGVPGRAPADVRGSVFLDDEDVQLLLSKTHQVRLVCWIPDHVTGCRRFAWLINKHRYFVVNKRGMLGFSTSSLTARVCNLSSVAAPSASCFPVLSPRL